LAVDDDHIVSLETGGQHQADNGDIRCPHADHRDFDLFHIFIDNFKRIYNSRQRHCRRPLLFVMPDRDAALFAQRIQDMEALRVFNVFQI